MGFVDRRSRFGAAIPLACALLGLWASPGNATGDPGLFGPGSLELSADVRAAAVGGEKSWVDGGFGKLRSGSNADVRLEPQLGNVTLAWKPQFTWSLGATVVGMIEGGQSTQIGLIQAYLSFRPMRSSKLAFSARAGLMWPPVSLEHEGADWHVKDSITPSAINSWIGEEVRPIAVEGTVSARLGSQKIRASGALIGANDTAGTLLTFRGWALHDRLTLAFNRQPLPPLGEFRKFQAGYTHPLLDVHRGLAGRVGYYAKLAWQPPVPVRVELFRYDNRADPQDVTVAGPEWGWRTRFNDFALVADLGRGTQFKSQMLEGTSRMGFRMPTRRWIDERFRSAYGMITQSVGKFTLAARGDLFETKGQGSIWSEEYGEHGWAAMASVKRDWIHTSALVELLHVRSKSPARELAAQAHRQAQTQLQGEVRIHW